jgi:hypothetical protein
MNQNEHLETLNEIRSLMERSSRFISLSGLSGVFAGTYALIGALAAYLYLNIGIGDASYYEYAFTEDGSYRRSFLSFFILDAGLVLLASVCTAYLLSSRKAKQKGQKIFDKTAVRLAVNLFIPLLAGGVFCLILLAHKLVGLIAPGMLVFYGLGLVNASKYTFDDIRYLGYCEIVLGLISAYYIGYGLLFWAAGFGVLHIIYGALMYNKYDRSPANRQ